MDEGCSGMWFLRPSPSAPLFCGKEDGHDGFHGEWVDVGEYLAPGLGPGQRMRPPSERDLREAKVRRDVIDWKLRGERQLGLEVFAGVVDDGG